MAVAPSFHKTVGPPVSEHPSNPAVGPRLHVLPCPLLYGNEHPLLLYNYSTQRQATHRLLALICASVHHLSHLSSPITAPCGLGTPKRRVSGTWSAMHKARGSQGVQRWTIALGTRRIQRDDI